MTIQISCPRCGKLVLPQNRYCEHCGVDLTVVALVAEQAAMRAPIIPSGTPIAPEMLVPRIGETMIEQGVLSPEDLQHALKYQKECASKGKPILLGEALLELKLISRETLDQTITSQIFTLHTALSEANKNLQKRVEERTRDLQRALDRLSELNALKSNFISNISHELRTPLTHIKGYLDLLSDGGLGPLTKAQAQAIDVLMRAENRLEQLIEDLIQFSLAARGELSLNLTTTQLDKLIQISVDRSKQKALPKDIKLLIEVSEQLPPIKIDIDKFGWVLSQLLDNAIKFTPIGGVVKVQATEESGLITVAVMDTGIGIPAKHITEIFEPFHQLDSSTTRRYAGTGLGLAMVRRIIESHGSEIKVESVVDKGTRFEFNLPIVKADVV
jgi:signal transduction histidine kinase